MKKIIVPALLIFAISILFFANYVYPLMSIFSQRSNMDFGIFRYFFVIASYICIIFTVWIEKENLASWNIDRLGLLALVLAAFVRVRLQTPNDEIYRNLITLLGLVLLGVCVVAWKMVPQTNIYWVVIGILTCILVIPMALIESTLVEKYTYSNILYQTKFFSYATRNLLYNVSFVAPYEEVIIRGILWGQLRKWNMAERKIVLFQGILFWSLHFWQIITPITFLMTVPMLVVVLSWLVMYSKQTFPSIVSHTLINTLLPIVISIFFSVPSP